MKKMILMFAALSAMAAFPSCKKQDNVLPALPVRDGEAEITVNLFCDSGPDTRAVSAYTASKEYETKIDDVQLIVFDENGDLCSFLNAGTRLSGISFKVTYGTKEIYAVINGAPLDGYASKSAFLAIATKLEDNKKSGEGGFLMLGHSTVTVSGPSASVSIAVSRLTARVALVGITHELPEAYSTIHVNRAFLANVVGNQNYAGNASPSLWYNKDGRADESTRNAAHVIDGSTYLASVPSLTYAEIETDVPWCETADFSSDPYLFYAYANSSAVAPSGFHNPFQPSKTVLVVDVNVGTKRYYYPVAIGPLAANTSYTVALTLTEIGSQDPDAPVQKSSLTANITVSGWGTGTVYDETI